MKILHTGDWHIGNFNGPEIGGQNARYLDICKCLDALTASAVTERPDLIIVAGDVFHQAKVWSDRGLKENQTAIRYIRLLEKVAPVVIVRGTPNHDSEQQFAMLETAFEGDDSVHIYTEPGVHKVHSYTGEAALIAALPGFDRGYYRAQNPGLDREEENERFTAILENIVVGMKATCKEQGDEPTILVSHFTIPGCCMESGQTQFFAQFEPVIYPATLNAAGYDLVCFGHIHRPQQIEDAQNTYYSGAISALNFNDEGQERGFWLHDTAGAPSRFITLPTREFFTVRLSEAGISALNHGELDDVARKCWQDKITGKIVRVIYDCTDEQNKALNKTALENALYKDGAFWVQEITPQKITITVNRNALGDDGSPEDNLRSYLEERGEQPDEIGELVDLARPIISEAVEANMTEARTGVFMPVEIEVKNYRNYRDEKFSFDSVRFCTINGSNGVGKSSLFMDAMLDALFEEPREGDLTGWICNDESARSGAIKFTFRLGDRLYRVTRTRAKSGKATLNLSEQVDGEWADRSREKFKDTQQEIINTIGMDSLTLKACALIMQDQYGLFLTADKESRMQILGNILGLGAYSDMEDIAANRLTDTNRTIRTLSDRVADITGGLPDPDALETAAAEAQAAIKAQEAESKELTDTATAKRVTLNTLLEAGRRAIKLNASIATLTARRAAAEATKTTQAGIVLNADAILSQGAEIAAGVALHTSLVAEEKTLISDMALYDSATARRAQLVRAVADEQAAIDKAADRRRANVSALETAKLKLAREPELAEKHTEYEAAKQAVTDMEELQADYTAKSDTVNHLEQQLMKLKAERGQGQAERRNLVLALEKRVELLDNSGCPNIDTASCRFLSDAIEARDKLPGAEADLETYTINAESAIAEAEKRLTDALAALEGSLYTPAKINALRASLRSLEAFETQYRGLAASRSDAQHLEEAIADIDRQTADHQAKMTAYQTELGTLAAQLEKLQTAADRSRALKAQITEAAVWLEKERLLPVAEEKKKAATARITELTADIGDMDAELLDKMAELDREKAASTGADVAQAEVDTLDAAIAERTKTIQNLSMQLGAIRKQQETAQAAREQVKALLEQVNGLSTTAAGLDTLKKAFSQDGIPHNIIRSIIPIFEATATNILGQMSGGKMAVEFVTEKVLKSNSKKEVTALDIIINDSDTGRLAYMSRSGGERVKAALSVILALAEIKSTKAGVQLGFLFIDEPPFLDAQGIQAYCDALEAIQGRYSDLKVMAITHDPTMKARFPQSIDIVKTAEGSKVIYA